MNSIEQEFINNLEETYWWNCEAFLEREILHWTSKILPSSPDERLEFDFKKKIADQFWIEIESIYIVWSSKLGYSIWKWTQFSYNSDIDIAIADNQCFNRFLRYVEDLDYYLNENQDFYTVSDHKKYYKFLRYMARWWFRPDKIPKLMPMNDKLQEDWFDFFRSISWTNCNLWDYQINCWLYRNKDSLKRYQLDWIKKKYISLTTI